MKQYPATVKNFFLKKEKNKRYGGVIAMVFLVPARSDSGFEFEQCNGDSRCNHAREG